MLGRPGCSAPVRKNEIAGAWFTASVCIDFMKQRSSTIARRVRQEIADPRAGFARAA